MDRRNILKVLDLAKAEQMIVVVLLACLLAGIVWRSGFHDTLPHPLVAVARSPKVAESRIDINSAPWHDLVILPGIGPRLAQRAVALRDAKAGGRFRRIEELAEVQGISLRMVERIRPHVSLGTAQGRGQAEVAR